MNLLGDLCFNGEIVVPGDSEYEEDRQVWNRSVQKYPKAILYCINKKDIIVALKFCTSRNLNFRIRSGGHNYEGYSVGNDIIVIDISRMKSITINEKDNTVQVEAGVQNKELYEYLGSREYPFPGGTCPTVGVAGYALGGGWGLSSRLFGLGCDNIVQVELVDYRGRIIIANKYSNKDLFFALRGAGGGNFGIITSLTFRLPPKFNKVTVFTIYYPKTTAMEQANIMDIFQKAYQTLDIRVNMRASFYNSQDEGMAVYIIGLFYGTEKELGRILTPFLLLPKANARFEYTSFINAIQKVGELYPESEKFKSTGTFVNRLYSMNELLILTSSLEKRPIGSVYAAITFYGLGGAVKNTGKNETAFYYRDADYIMGIQSVWEENLYAEENKKWVACRLNYIKSITNGFYINFPYSPLMHNGEEYYGENIIRLKAIKKKYDPFNIFSYPQGIK